MKTLTYVLLTVAAAITLGEMFQAAAGELSGGSFVFMALAISPYIVFGLVAYLVGRFTKIPHSWAVAGVIALLMLLFTAYAYLMAMDGSSSTEALAFVAVPLYLHVGAYVLFALGLVAAKLFGSKTQD